MQLTGPSFEREVQRPLSTAQMLAAVLPQAARKRQGVLSKSIEPGPMRVRQEGLPFGVEHIRRYREVCGFRAQPSVVPLTYPEMHFTALIAEAVVSPQFPLSPLGLIHTGQRVELHQPLLPGAVVDATTELVSLHQTDRGYELEFSMLVERAGQKLWSGLATLLSRSPEKRSPKKHETRRAASPDQRELELSVPGNTGLRYARVSGDYNPHHLWRITARPLGYRRPIAHGMWTFARVLSEVLEGVDEAAPVQADAAFKRPLLMPSRIRVSAPRLSREPREVCFSAREARTGAPHLVGRAAYSR
jgi:acyl dehydratase